MLVQAYLFFDGQCEEAVEFYRKAVGAEVLMLMRYKDSPEPFPPGMIPASEEKRVMHVSFRIGETNVMASDCPPSQQQKFGGFSLSLLVNTPDEAQRLFNALADGGKITMPLAKTFWSPLYGMLVDRFGVSWMVNVHAGN